MEDRKTDGFAKWSFIVSLIVSIPILIRLGFRLRTGIFSFIFSLYIPLALIAVALGVTGLIRIKRNNNLKGNVYAILGIVIQILLIVFFVLLQFN
jgi:hypothetical protein